MPSARTLPLRPAARETEGVAAREHVAQPGQHAQAAPVGRPELELEEADRLDHLAVERLVDPARAEGEHDRSDVRGGELVVRELNVADEGRPVGLAARDRPRDANGLSALGGDDDDAARSRRRLGSDRRDADRDVLRCPGLERQAGRIGREGEVRPAPSGTSPNDIVSGRLETFRTVIVVVVDQSGSSARPNASVAGWTAISAVAAWMGSTSPRPEP